MILPKIRDKRFITIRRGGTLSDEVHRLLAVWAAQCSHHVLYLFEQICPDDNRPHLAIKAAYAWANGEISMKQARFAAGASQDAAREVKEISEAARLAALSAGQAAVVAHVAAHELGAAAYAIRAVMAASHKNEKELHRQQECQWQRDILPEKIHELVFDDERLRNDICWFVFGEDHLVF